MNEAVNAQSVLDWLYRQQKEVKTNLGRAEARPGVKASEIASLTLKLSYIDYLIGITIEKL
jgi:hypothetical protein